MSALAALTREPGWYRYAGLVERYHDGYGWTDHYRSRQRVTTPPVADPAPEQPVDPAPDPDPTPDPEPEEQLPETDLAPREEEARALGATSPAPRAQAGRDPGREPVATQDAPQGAPTPRPGRDRPPRPGRNWGRRTEPPTDSGPTPTRPLGAHMALSSAGSLIVEALREMGYDPDRVTSLHVSRDHHDRLQALVAVVEGALPNDLGVLPQRTETVYLSS